MVNTSQQVGGAIGTALLNTIAASATTSWLAAHATEATTLGRTDFANLGAVHGYTTAIWWAVGILVAAAAVSAVLIRTKGHEDTATGSTDGIPAQDATENDVPAMPH
ncbi:hypothetical protein GCM10020295_01530 [Streptomyces cinereospinus]